MTSLLRYADRLRRQVYETLEIGAFPFLVEGEELVPLGAAGIGTCPYHS